MGYSKELLEHYAQSVWDDELREEALRAVGTIEFIMEEGEESCAARQAREALKGTKVEYLIDDLRRNFTHFLTPDDLRTGS